MFPRPPSAFTHCYAMGESSGGEAAAYARPAGARNREAVRGVWGTFGPHCYRIGLICPTL